METDWKRSTYGWVLLLLALMFSMFSLYAEFIDKPVPLPFLTIYEPRPGYVEYLTHDSLDRPRWGIDMRWWMAPTTYIALVCLYGSIASFLPKKKKKKI